MIVRVLSVEVCGTHSLHVTFSDGTRKRVHVRPLLEGPVFLPLRDPDYFSRVMVDAEAGTVVWPNGADLAPEALQELPDEGEASPPRRVVGA